MLQRLSSLPDGHVLDRSRTPLLLLALAILLFQLALLYAVGRPLICPCGTLRLWQGDLDPIENSQQIADPYSLLHGTFGLFLFLWIRWMCPNWGVPRIGLVALLSSAIWEVIENLPPVVERFGAEGNDLHYVGDSLVNSVGDTLFVMIGVLVATRLPVWATLLLAGVIEAGVYGMIGDSILVGTVRFALG